MAILKQKEIRNMDAKSMEDKIKEVKLEMLKLKAQRSTQSSAGNKKVKELKKTIARIKTNINQNKKLNLGGKK